MSPQVADFCCKSLFALVIKISFGCTRDFRVNMWGTSLPEDKLAGDLGNVIGPHRSAVVGRIFLQQENWRRAIWDFCNNIGTGLPSGHVRIHAESWRVSGLRPGVVNPAALDPS